MTDKTTITVMQSQLARARGKGSSHSGVGHWLSERITAIALVPLTLWFIASVLRLLGASQPAVAAWAGHPVNTALLLALIAFTFHHMQLGLQVVIEDYVDDERLVFVLLMLVKGAALLLGLMASVAVLKLALLS